MEAHRAMMHDGSTCQEKHVFCHRCCVVAPRVHGEVVMRAYMVTQASELNDLLQSSHLRAGMGPQCIVMPDLSFPSVHISK